MTRFIRKDKLMPIKRPVEYNTPYLLVDQCVTCIKVM